MEAKTEVNARKEKLDWQDALELLKGVHHLYAAKGKKVVHFDLRQGDIDEAALKKMVLGPTGNLRAPVLRKGKTLIVGFNQATYQDILGS